MATDTESERVLDREEFKYVCGNVASGDDMFVSEDYRSLLAHDAALRETVARQREALAEADDVLDNIGGHASDAIAGRITPNHAVGDIAAELDDYDARRALDPEDDDER